ncbi:MAG: PASTA domain-containing protein [Acidobacteria bacterium]|nr:PASTA domain-containing protein [Acidobacteriota bacterium]
MSTNITLPKPLNGQVQPGDPIRAEDWRNVVTGITHIYEVLNKPAAVAGDLWVEVTGKNGPVANATVTVVPAGEKGAPRVGQYAGAGYKKYLVTHLVDGEYSVNVEAPGYLDAEGQPKMSEGGKWGEMAIKLKPAEATSEVPELFGNTLAEAMKKIRDAKFQVGDVIDSHGNEVPTRVLAEAAKTLAVLGQAPEAGAVRAQKTQIHLHVAARLDAARQITVPNLRGLTVDEARAKLAELGLELGEVTNVAVR